MENASTHAVPFDEPAYFSDIEESDVCLVISAHHSREDAARLMVDHELWANGAVVPIAPESLERVTAYLEDGNDGPTWEIAHSGRVPPQAERSCLVWLASFTRGGN